MRGSYSGSTGHSKRSSVGSIPTPRALDKNIALCYIFLLLRNYHPYFNQQKTRVFHQLSKIFVLIFVSNY